MSDRGQEALQRWQAAEDRVYQVVLLRPDLYELTIRLVQAVANDLREWSSLEGLLEAQPRAPEIVATAMRRLEIPAEVFRDLGLVADAAFSMRYRQVRGDERHQAAAERVRTAREQGDEWVLVHEAGNVAFPEVLPYHRMEVRVVDGTGLHAFVEIDPGSWEPRYGLERIRMDLEGLAVVDESARAASRRFFHRRDAWEAAISDLREGRDPGVKPP